MSSNEMTVAVLGLGAMGLPMATCLAKGNHRVTAFDISTERLELAGESGVAPAGSAAEASEAADAVVIGVRDAAQLEAALFGPGGAAGTMRPGAVVILTSTVGAAVAEAVAERLAELEVLLVDAPVSG